MRKVIMLILFTFLLVPLYKVKAINTFDLPINQNISISKVTEKYKWYKLNEVDSRNENVFEHNCEYLELRETDYSFWSTEKPEQKYGRIIEEKEETSEDAVEYYYLKIDNILTSNLRTFEIRLYDEDNKRVNYYNVVCYNCSSTFPRENLFDNDFNTYFEVKFNQPITLILNEKTSKNIRVQFLYNKEDYLFGYRISKLDKYFNVIESKEENVETLVNRGAQYYSSYINSTNNNWKNIIKYYRYKDEYLVCSEKEYLDDYYEEVDGYIKDENRSIKSYDYEDVNVEPEIIEKEVLKEVIVPEEKTVFKEVLVPEEKIVYKYIENNSNNSCEYVSSQNIELDDKKEEIEVSSQVLSNNSDNKKITKRDIKFYVIFSIILLLIIFLCLFIKELIKKCR